VRDLSRRDAITNPDDVHINRLLFELSAVGCDRIGNQGIVRRLGATGCSRPHAALAGRVVKDYWLRLASP